MVKKLEHYALALVRIAYELMRLSIIIIALLLIILYFCGIRPYIVKSGSMEPAIMTGSVCFVNHNANYSDIKSGDIITFELGDESAVTHRAVSIEKDGIRTKGDANETEDAVLVTEDTFIGKTMINIPKIGFLITRLKTRNGIIMTVSIMVLLLLLGRIIEKPHDDTPKETK